MTAQHRARARKLDPFTSHAAAEVATRNLPTVRAAVYAILDAAAEPMTHDRLIAEYRRWQMNGKARSGASDSSIRTRCKELERDGEVVVLPVGVGRSRYGNAARLYTTRARMEAVAAAIAEQMEETP